MDDVICFEPFIGGPIFHGNDFNIVAVVNIGDHVKLLPLPHPPVRARTDARTNPNAQRATQLSSVLARLRCRKTEPNYY
jgi:hypothetical protein